MKTKLLKKLRKKIGIYYSKEKKVTNTQTGEPIKGRFCVYCPSRSVWYYCESREEAISNRRDIILFNLYQMRRYKNKHRRKLII